MTVWSRDQAISGGKSLQRICPEGHLDTYLPNKTEDYKCIMQFYWAIWNAAPVVIVVGDLLQSARLKRPTLKP